jgi:hypothetical protein
MIMLSWIASDFFARSPVLVYPLIALLLFMAVFVTAALRAALADRAQIDRMARLPLERGREDEEVHRG